MCRENPEDRINVRRTAARGMIGIQQI